MGGGNSTERHPIAEICGLSPRGRGKPLHAPLFIHRAGSIPAWAGETGGYRTQGRRRGVYPRVGGGNSTRYTAKSQPEGLSPRGRRKPLHKPEPRKSGGSIPAWAGETSVGYGSANIRAVYPRVGGGNLYASSNRLPSCGLSPRGRGKPRALEPAAAVVRSIPAWAGETPRLQRIPT